MIILIIIIIIIMIMIIIIIVIIIIVGPIARPRPRARLRAARDSSSLRSSVGFHNYNLRIFNLRVSNPNKLIVDVLLTRCRISMCQGLGPRKHDEISEIDRSGRWCLRTRCLMMIGFTFVRFHCVS